MATTYTHSLDEKLLAAQRAYTESHPKSQTAHKKAVAHLPGGNTRTVIHITPFPLTFTKARGAWLESVDGHTYIDFLSEYTAALLGHSNKRIINAISTALSHGYNYGAPNVYERELARLVCERFAPAVELVRFANSGTEANMLAIAAAKAFTGRKHGKVLVFGNGYHGSTIGFRDGNADDPMLLPHDWAVAPYNNVEGTRAVLENLGGGEIAAILVEPVQGSGGAIPCDRKFLHFLREQATSRGAVLICDEVMTSRLAYSGLSQEMGVRPDLMTFGKWIGGGMTFGAFGGRRDIMSLFNPERTDGRGLTHAGTFNNNIVSMAAGCEALTIYDRTAIEKTNGLGELLKKGVDEALQRNRISVDISEERIWISGRGSILAMHFKGKKSEVLKALFWHHMLDNGIYMAPRGFVCLNVEHERQHIDKFVAAVEDFAKGYAARASVRAKL